MNAARNGIVAQFVTAYLQREIPMKAIVTGGTDAGLRDGLQLGFAPGRLVKITNVNGVNYVAAATGVTSKSIGDATHIIAQSDDTVRDVPQDFNYTERYDYVPNLICKNSTEEKTIAVYKIVNVDDIKLVKIAEPVTITTAVNASGTFKEGAATFQFVQTGINTFKVIGTAPYIASPIVEGNPAGNYLYFAMKDADISAKTDLPSGVIYKRYSALGENSGTRDAFETDGSIKAEVCIKDATSTTTDLTVEIEWTKGNVSTYKFDLTDLKMEVSE